MTFDDIRKGLENEPAGPQKGMLNDLILRALQDICEKTWIFSEKLTFLTTAGTSEYTLSPSDSDTAIIGILPDSVQIATVNSPVPSAAAGTGTGTLTSGTTYSYKVTAICDDYRETLPSAACTATATATGSIAVSWDAIDNADGYRVYGRTADSWLLMDEVTTAAYTDDGSDTPSGAIPTKSRLMQDIRRTSHGLEKGLNPYWMGYESDSISGVIYDGKSSVELNEIPVTTGIGFQLDAALKPTAEIDIPTILEAQQDIIHDYVRWKLYSMPVSKTVTWSDPEGLGKFYYYEYMRKRKGLRFKVHSRFGGDQRCAQQFFA